MRGTQEQLAIAKVARLKVPEPLNENLILHTTLGEFALGGCEQLLRSQDKFHRTAILDATNASLAWN